MAQKKGLSKLFVVVLGLIVGLAGGMFGYTYFTLPETEVVSVTEEVFYSNNPAQTSDSVDLASYGKNVSVHFLELGNKYTGDCTYIKTDTCDILIDCGSKSNSVSTVANYLNKYVTDGILEYVIVTHAHQDHYAGFATTTKVDSIFDLYECKTIIDFAQTNQKETSTVYGNYKRELADEVANGAKHYTALQCVNESDGAKKVWDIGTEAKLEILNSEFYTAKSSTENNYSVCCMISHEGKNFLFTGDLEEDGEKSLVALNSLPEVDLYKAGHHGSGTSSCPEFMAIVQPKTVCVCCCAGSSEYTSNPEKQFPTQQFINNVAPHTDEIYVTTMCVDYKNNLFQSFNGNIVYISVEADYYVVCSNNGTKLKESQWFKDNRTWI